MAGRYGMSFAKKHIEDGEYEEAIKAATQSIEDGDAGPEPLFDRATAYDLAERYLEAVADFEAAITKNGAEQEIDPFTIDDAYFSALLQAARNEAEKDVAKGVTLLQRYMQFAPKGEHVADCGDWQKRLKGEMPSLLDKTKDVDAV
jgi:tetratricopeptide (TPR) repeat protein